ncbi:FRIGIDA-like protein 3 isoform X2 [Hibiscus syriacus]|uniref:FRIGIDA-like protein 3 isoform X2 n=1 Tax=Hibiscus syriacus TaxID=106335 RepID=UPI0019231B14|nr:FRIGIDA-like protein 3 isoform X2 [Hibiscus syriacus]
MDGIEQHEPNDSASSLIDQLYKAVHELEAFNGASESKVHWTEIEQYFCNLKVTLKKKSEDLEAKEKEYEVKEAKTIALIVEKETIVATKEQDYLDHVQELKNAAVASIAEARASFQSTTADSLDAGENGDTKLAKAIADEWKPKLSNVGSVAADDNSLEAEAFLQLLATFKIASEFDEEHLCKLVFVVAHLRQAPELCRSIGLALKMPGLFELLINSGRKVDAIRFIHTFQLSERFPPVPLLKMFLKDLLRNSQGKGGNSRAAYGSQDDINARELAALEAVISCLQDYGLEADYSLDPLQKRLAQLEKAKADSKKRGGDSSKHHPWKKSRPNGGFRGFRGPPGRQAPQVYNQRAAFTGRPERYTPACSNPYSYQVLYQPAYAPQANDQRLYYYTQDDKIPTPLYNATTSNYGSYSGGGLQPSQQPYM